MVSSSPPAMPVLFLPEFCASEKKDRSSDKKSESRASLKIDPDPFGLSCPTDCSSRSSFTTLLASKSREMVHSGFSSVDIPRSIFPFPISNQPLYFNTFYRTYSYIYSTTNNVKKQYEKKFIHSVPIHKF